MNYIEKAFEQKLTGDDFLQAMADFYSEPERHYLQMILKDMMKNMMRLPKK